MTDEKKWEPDHDALAKAYDDRISKLFGKLCDAHANAKSAGDDGLWKVALQEYHRDAIVADRAFQDVRDGK